MSVTIVFVTKLLEQVPEDPVPQEIPEGLDVTEPVPETETESVLTASKFAVQVFVMSIVTPMDRLVLVEHPDHARKA